MKRILISIAILLAAGQLQAQGPSGYYNPIMGKTGGELRVALHHIIKGHSSIDYSDIWDAIYTTDRKSSGKLWDMYSDIPGGSAPYEYNMTDRCYSASPTSENDCYNREHTWPRSKFGDASPMNSDLWIVFPTDGFVNGKRSNFPYGKVTSPSWSSRNGSKLGPNTYAGAPSTVAFEPIDSFKGDIARAYFYVSTRYYSQDGGWDNWEMANGADLKPWAKQMLLEWHRMDPVSAKEIARNEAVYRIQGNRNPYIDHPELAECVFGTADCTDYLSSPAVALNQYFDIYPNPASSIIHITYHKLFKQINCKIFDMLGRELISIQSLKQDSPIDIQFLSSGNYTLQFITEEGSAHIPFTKR